ncbi:hypothetical protein ZIOFF_030421 [Zingiber officinale]|uniref:Uncharacterized protein n=1 Tax=Zingiber officinale TaxID=94328 RepID=A0A8J5LBE4_ZINOF|nr:hypothetical protein ZIOFF_030421 [Zingiber officinale]
MKPDKEGQDSPSTFIRQVIGKDPLSRTGGKQIPFELWKGEPTDVNEAKEPSCSSNDNEYAFKGTKASSEQMQALRFPEAILAFAQAAARANDFNTTKRENEDHHPVELNESLGPTAAIDYKSKRTIRNGHTVQFPGAKPSVSMRYGPYKDLKATSSASNKIWTQKNKHEEAPYDRIDRIHQDQSVNPDSSEVIIGSILVALGSGDGTRSKPDKLHAKQHNMKPPNGMLWKPAGLHDNRSGWKEAIVANHVRLVLPFEVEVSDDYDTAENGHYEMMPEKPCASNGMEKGYDSFVGGRSCSTEKASRRAGSIEPSNSSKHKFKTKPEKDSKLKYVPKQTHNAMGE